ncbi:MAG: hypothetical protein QOE24_1920, partial [Frankiales bacterium]|nr:hypothetical protein [Frankiales bacterium]
MSEYGSRGDGDDAGRFVPPSTPHDAGSADNAFDVTPAGDDAIGSPEPQKPRRAPVLLAMVAVLAMVLAGGAVAFVRSSSPASGALTKLVPAGSYGYLQLDLKQSSSAGLYEYLTHFPGSPATKPDAHKGTFRDTLLGSVFTSSAKIDYSRDIQPWLGSSAGIAVFRGTNGDPVPLVVVATTDAAKARAGLARIRATDSSFAYDIVDGDVLLAQRKADLDAAQAQAKAAALPSSANYSADIASLPSGSLVTMWADLDKISAAAKSAMTKACVAGSSLGGACSAFNNFSSLGVLGALGGGATGASGRLALGISVADKVATMTVRELGHKASASKATVGDEIKKLPADTTGAIAFGDVSTGIDQAFTSIGTAFGAVFGAGMSASASGGMAYASAMAPTPMSSGATDGLVSGSAVSSIAPAAMASAMPALPMPLPSTFPSAYPAALPSGSADASTMPGLTMQQDVTQFDPTKAISDSLKQVTGLTFPGDCTALLGDRSVVALGDV